MYSILHDMCGDPCTIYQSCDGDLPITLSRTHCNGMGAKTTNPKFLPPDNMLYNLKYSMISIPPKGLSKEDLWAYPNGLKYAEQAKLYLEDQLPPFPNVPKAAPSCSAKAPPEDLSNSPYYPPYTYLNVPVPGKCNTCGAV